MTNSFRLFSLFSNGRSCVCDTLRGSRVRLFTGLFASCCYLYSCYSIIQRIKCYPRNQAHVFLIASNIGIIDSFARYSSSNCVMIFWRFIFLAFSLHTHAHVVFVGNICSASFNASLTILCSYEIRFGILDLRMVCAAVV